MRSSQTSRTTELDSERRSTAFVAATIVVALLLAADLARLFVSAAVADDNPTLAEQLVPRSPTALTSASMAEVGQAAANGADLKPATVERLRAIAAQSPLRAEPFLVEAALAERAGDYPRAEMLLDQARLRQPRSAAARYLLADVLLRENKVVEGLREMAILSRLVPQTSVQLVPALSQYAQTPGAREKLAGILRDNSNLKQPLLNALAADPDNADLVIALAGRDARAADPESQAWQSRLIGGFVVRGDYDRAYTVWRRFAGAGEGPRPLLFNGDFRRVAAPPPFNWSFTSASAGVAEPDNGRLRVLFYGREDATLAWQLLLLPPGQYRFAAPIGGDLPPGALTWALSCLAGSNPIIEMNLGGSAASAASFTVPANCPAQKLELKGHLQDMPKDSDVRIGPARMEKAGA